MKRTRKSKDREKGHLMAGLMAAVAIMMIFSTMAFQAWSEVLRRDNEAEMMFRAQDLVRAIQRYRRDHGGMGPEKLEQLLEPGPKRQYYARQVWTDPLVPDGKWGLLYFGPGGALVDPSNELQGGGLGGGLGQQGAGGQSGNRVGLQVDRLAARPQDEVGPRHPAQAQDPVRAQRLLAHRSGLGFVEGRRNDLFRAVLIVFEIGRAHV